MNKSRLDFRIRGNVSFLRQNVQYALKFFQINDSSREFLKEALDRFIRDVEQVVESNRGAFEDREEKELLKLNREIGPNPYD